MLFNNASYARLSLFIIKDAESQAFCGKLRNPQNFRNNNRRTRRKPHHQNNTKKQDVLQRHEILDKF
jgi:hypothetical protein